MSNFAPWSPWEPSLPELQKRDMQRLTDRGPRVTYPASTQDETLPPFRPAGLPKLPR